MDEDFWKTWAANEATAQWYVYGDRREKAVPGVESVEAVQGRFRVTFVNGDVLDVVPSGLARPARVLAPLE